VDFSIEYNEEQEAFAKEVRAWLDENIPEDLENPRDILDMTREQYEIRREIARKLGAKGWLYPGFPAEYGGGELPGDHRSVLYKEFAARHLGVPPHYDSGKLAAPTIMATGTEEQKKRLLPPILKGEKVTWQLFTEPEAGTDEANQQTNALRAVKEGEYFIVNGSKIFVGGIYAPPDQFLLLTRSDLDAPRHQNLAMFIAPSDLPGIQILPLDLFPAGTFGQTCYENADGAPGVKHSVFFEDVKVHESCLIGGDHDGWKVTTATLTVEHGDRSGEHVATGGVYIPQNLMVEKFLDQCRNNPVIKRRLHENPQLLENVVDVYIDHHIERLLAIRNSWLPRSGKRAPYAGPQHALYNKLFGLKFSNCMARVLGPYAFTKDEEWGLEDEIFEVGERSGICTAPGGTPEALKIVISRALRIGR
jgi:alkylation response protein AidB-like acyl-CoA dehydrogenase